MSTMSTQEWLDTYGHKYSAEKLSNMLGLAGMTKPEDVGTVANYMQQNNKPISMPTNSSISGAANQQIIQTLAQQPQVQQPQQPQFDMAAYIRQLQQAQEQAQIANLTKSRQNQLSNLGAEESKIAPAFYEAKRQQIGTSQAGQRGFADYLAQRGLNSSGLAGQGEMMRQGALQGTIGALNQQETQAKGDINRRRTDIENAYQQDIVSAQAGIQAQGLQNLINQMNLDRQFGLQQAGVTGFYNGQQTLQGQQAQLSMQGQQLQNQLAQLQLQNMPQQIQQQSKLIEQQLRSGDLSIQQAEFNLKQLQDPNSPVNLAKQLELQMKQLEAQYAEPMAKAQLQQLQKSIAQIGKAPYRSAEQVEMDKLRLEQARIELQNLQNPQTQVDFKPYRDKINQITQVGGTNEDIAKYLQNLEISGIVPSSVVDQLLIENGLPLGR